jgi:hypothetical protein
MEMLAPLMNGSQLNGKNLAVEHRVISPQWEAGSSLQELAVNHSESGAKNSRRELTYEP